MTLYDRLTVNPDFRNAKELGIVFNSTILSRNKKMVYVSYDAVKDKLVFYIKDSLNHKKIPIDLEEHLEKAIRSSSLFGINTELPETSDFCTVTIDNDLGFVFIESSLYALVRKQIVRNSNTTISIGNKQLTAAEMNNLVITFKERAIVNYPDVVYSTRFRNKLFKAVSFFGIQKAFVPVYIDCKYLFNPLKFDTSLYYNRTLINKMASQRSVEVLPDDVLTANFLTSLEICKAFNMSNFVRFSYKQYYYLLMGLIKKDLAGFPSKSVEAHYNPVESNCGLSRVYSESDFFKVKSVFTEVLSSPASSDEEKRKAKMVLEELQAYTIRDTLYAFCADQHSALTSFGPTLLDRREDCTPNELYRYLKQAELVFI